MSEALNTCFTVSDRHAYLILAHHEFEVLAYLVAALDDSRNDIYIHYDKKLSHLPQISTQKAKLIILEKRIDVRWGDVSVVAAELLLFESAYLQGNYSYYHLLSGVDLPLYNQDYVHRFFKKREGKEFIGFSCGDQRKHIERKVQRYHLFPNHFRGENTMINFTRKGMRFLWLRMQLALGIKRNREIIFKKGTQWVSLTHNFVAYILTKKEETLHRYRNTFCADEIVVQTLCWNSPFREAIYDLQNEAEGSQRMIQWIDNQIYDWELKDFSKLISSDLLFARKFNSQSSELLNKLADHINGSK
ncbi:beta-1,6-N-acetylglucosaminyltransferase [Sphingobacterium sp. lm-10]|uniref:beta-1,6-N-acetylglucosaminyltransferase n=1 Tax=Sphingobacterium sp. lm-10 TaxID=2944904 RepID=UPI0020204388|nr:beta-1,6-N-acetylglucosaminyltransferase [Sphingobacterium sp. lm-10]MCL7988413.1 beta-1,6-N-acetylglucosaminyltransferase [Sphingobacterium sp. lm-10]